MEAHSDRYDCSLLPLPQRKPHVLQNAHLLAVSPQNCIELPILAVLSHSIVCAIYTHAARVINYYSSNRDPNADTSDLKASAPSSSAKAHEQDAAP